MYGGLATESGIGSPVDDQRDRSCLSTISYLERERDFVMRRRTVLQFI